MATCPSCNKSCDAEWKFCAACGHALANDSAGLTADKGGQRAGLIHHIGRLNTPRHRRIVIAAILIGLIWLLWPSASAHHPPTGMAADSGAPDRQESTQKIIPAPGIGSGIWGYRMPAGKPEAEPGSVPAKAQPVIAKTAPIAAMSAQKKPQTSPKTEQQPIEKLGPDEEAELNFAEKLLADREYFAAIAMAKNTFRAYPDNPRALNIISRADAARQKAAADR